VAGKKEERAPKGEILLQDKSTAASRGGVREALLRRLLDGEFPVDRDWRGDLAEEKESEFDCCSGGSFQVLVGGDSGRAACASWSCLVTEGGKTVGSPGEQSIAARYRLATDGRFLDMTNQEDTATSGALDVSWTRFTSCLFVSPTTCTPTLSMLSIAVLSNLSCLSLSLHVSLHDTHTGWKTIDYQQRCVGLRCQESRVHNVVVHLVRVGIQANM
jgi:hypothetical protein